MTRLLVCDDAPESRAMLRATLADHRTLEVVGEAEDGTQAIELARSLVPDVVLMDVEMPVLGGVDATRQIRALLPETRVVAFAGSDESAVVMAMMEAGASAYCAKSADLWELERAITGATDPILRIARAMTRALPGASKLELAAAELRRLTGAQQVTAYVPEQDTEPAPGAVVQAFGASGLTRDGDLVAVPLVAGGRTLGVLALSGLGDDIDLGLVSEVAEITASSLALDHSLEESIAEARRDPLTGLSNRRAFDERLAAALRAGGPTSLVLLDLDDFKHVNDTRGHDAGDEVLRQVAVALLREVRADEEVFRIGGEEFAVVVEGDSAAAFRVAARMRAALVRQRRGQPLPTLSAGIASAPGDGLEPADLFRAADAALYAAKWAGKNRVLVYGAKSPVAERGRRRILVVDDDEGLRALLRATFEGADVEVSEARDVDGASRSIARSRPDVVILDIAMPGIDGLTFCRSLKAQSSTSDIGVVLLTGSIQGDGERQAREAGADAFLRKPFSPLDLLSVVEAVAHGRGDPHAERRRTAEPKGQLMHYAEDLRRLLELERRQRALLQRAYRDTVTALATALESKDAGTGAHSERVQRYAVELTRAVAPDLLDDASLEYGFLLHDIGKIGVPDRILLKPAALSEPEARVMQMHTVIGEQMLGEISLLKGECLHVVRSHHERWDGDGYPDGLAGTDIPLGARIFAVADTLDAVTSERPYRSARSWDAALAEIAGGAGSQFDPSIASALERCEPELREIAHVFAPG